MQSNLCTIFMLWFALVTGASAAESLDQGASANPRETSAAKGQAHRILVYTRNGPTLDGKPGYVHDNIASSVAAIRQLGKENGFDVDVSDDPGAFTGENLKKYKVLVFSNTNNESIETEDQKAAFQRFIRAGGGYPFRVRIYAELAVVLVHDRRHVRSASEAATVCDQGRRSRAPVHLVSRRNLGLGG